MTTAVKTELKPDALGLAVAEAAQRAAAPDTVILFGSRARGDHRAGSDVDLLIVRNDKSIPPRGSAWLAVDEYFAANPPELHVDIITMSREQFAYCSRAQNHVAGQALRDGVIMSGENLDCPSDYDDGYPVGWPDIRQRLVNANRYLRSCNILMEQAPDDQESYGFFAQQAVENAIKAWISAADLSYRFRLSHDIAAIADVILNDPEQSETLAGHQLRLLLDYTSYPNPKPDHPVRILNWLTEYAVDYRYGGTGYRMDGLDRNRFRQEINLVVHTIVNHVYDITGTNPSDLE